MSKLIIDVSYHNGVINWERVKASGCAGAILRCGYGDDIASQDDKQWIRNLAECERLGIPVGVYLYSYATCDRQAQSELDHILRLIKGHTFQLPIFLDVEEPGTQGYAPKACEIVCEGLKAAGYTPGIYASLSWLTTILAVSVANTLNGWQDTRISRKIHTMVSMLFGSILLMDR